MENNDSMFFERSPKENTKEKLKTLIDNLENSDINESEISELKSKMKEIEKKIKENNKPKTITISAKDHNIIKKHCTTYGLNIGDWVAKIVLKEINDNACVIIEDGDAEEIQKKRVKELTDKFIGEQNRRKYLIKTNKIIVNTQFKFEGYSIIDSMPIYEFVGDMAQFKMLNDLDERGHLKGRRAKRRVPPARRSE